MAQNTAVIKKSQDSSVVKRNTSDNSPEVERRAQTRYPNEGKSIIRMLARPYFQSLTAVVLNANVAGLGLLTSSRLEPGTILTIQVQRRQRGLSSIVSARVIHAEPRPDGNWHVGCKFSTLLKEEEVETLLANGLAPAEEESAVDGRDRRAWVRYHHDPEASCITGDTHPDMGLCTARVRDISHSGISLVLNRHLKVGAFLAVELVNTRQTCLPPLLARVVHATAQISGDWLIGCEFSSVLTDDELQQMIT